MITKRNSCLYSEIDLITLLSLVLFTVYCQFTEREENGCKGEVGGSVKCGPKGPKHHAVGCLVQMGCQLILPADPKKQPAQQPSLPVQVLGP